MQQTAAAGAWPRTDCKAEAEKWLTERKGRSAPEQESDSICCFLPWQGIFWRFPRLHCCWGRRPTAISFRFTAWLCFSYFWLSGNCGNEFVNRSVWKKRTFNWDGRPSRHLKTDWSRRLPFAAFYWLCQDICPRT